MSNGTRRVDVYWRAGTIGWAVASMVLASLSDSINPWYIYITAGVYIAVAVWGFRKKAQP